MRSSKIVHIVGGVAPPPGDTLWEQSRHVATDGELRTFVLNEPPSPYQAAR